MTAHRWQPRSDLDLPDPTPAALRRLAVALEGKEHPGATLLATDDDAVAVVVPLARILGDSELEVRWTGEAPEDPAGTALWISESTPEEAVRALLAQLVGEDLGSPTPSWAMAGPGRSALAAVRASGPTGVVQLQGDHGTAVNLALFPIRLSSSDALRRRLTPEDKLPEGLGDNLDKRADWFQRRSGEGGGNDESR